jgi:hypothetical protein
MMYYDTQADSPLMMPGERRTLETQKVGSTLRQSMQVNVEEDFVRQELIQRITAYVLSDHLAADEFTAYTTATWPATTWQMFKSCHAGSWWLGWLVRRRPVRLHTERQQVAVQVDRYLNYPEANLALPSLGTPVVFERAMQIRP